MLEMTKPQEMTVSLCVIAKNEERTIQYCLNSVQTLVQEIILVDTGSSDATANLAKKAGAKVYNFAWKDNFAAARNFSLTKATKDWILVLDADEVLEYVNPQDFQDLLRNNQVEGYYLQFINNLGKEQGIFSDKAVRLFRNNSLYRFRSSIHEQVAASILEHNNGQGLAESSLTIVHSGYTEEEIRAKNKHQRNMTIIKKELANKPDEPFLLYSLAHEYLQQHQIPEGVANLEKAISLMQGTEGYFEDAIIKLAFSLLALGDTDKSIDFVSKSLVMFSEHADLLTIRGIALYQKCIYPEALLDLEHSLQVGGSRLYPPAELLRLSQDCLRQTSNTEKIYTGIAAARHKRILVASPIHQKEIVLREFLDSLAKLDTVQHDLDYVFINDQNEHNLLNDFADSHTNVKVLPGEAGVTYVRDETTHHWNKHLIWKVAEYKNRFIKMAREEEYDYLFLVDSDLYLHPQTINHLISTGKDIISEVYWTVWRQDLIPLPQVWVGDDYRMYYWDREEELSEEEKNKRILEFLQMLSSPGTYKVGGLGACTLISRKALTTGVSFSEIYNLGYSGEDRHFCIRAAALGLELYADTHYPPFHIYRESDLKRLPDYKSHLHYSLDLTPTNIHATEHPQITTKQHTNYKSSKQKSENTITLMMLVRNESERYLENVLTHTAQYIDQAVILDDASDDHTVEICNNLFAQKEIPLIIASNQNPSFQNEILLRKQLWQMTIETNPDWIIALDADEIFEDIVVPELKKLASQNNSDVISFRLFDMWADNYYREDAYWSAHKYYRPFMVRYIPGFNYRWQETPQHCGRLPYNIPSLRVEPSQLRLKHLGWLRPQDRLQKYYRYKKLDPEARYGIAEQYDSILDPCPNLIPWVD